MQRMTAVAIVVLVAAAAAHAGELAYTAPEYQHQKITVQAEKIWLKKDKLWFKLNVINGTGKMLAFDKEQLQAKTADGRVLSRARSVFAGRAKPSFVPPGLSKPLWVEYVIGEMPLEVSLLFKIGFLLDGKPLELPDYVARPFK